MNNKPLKKCSLTSKYLSLPLIIGSIILSGQSMAYAECSTDQAIIPYEKSAEYRRINGTRNNPHRSGWGAAGKKLLRKAGTDDFRVPNTHRLPNPREISNTVSRQGANENTLNAKGLSDIFWLWGQFLDHDITIVHTDASRPANIPVPAGDPDFSHLSSLPFSRSVLGGRRNNYHPNALTSFIDGSNIYGSDTTNANSLRTFQGGELKMDAGFLPKDDVGFYLAGDERANEHIGLTAMHTLWVREHNRLARAIACEYPNWKDKQLYNEARRVVIAELQAITYNEFLPALLGENTLSGYWEYTYEQNPGYDGGIQPNISNVFAVSAFRFGHSMLSPVLLRLDKDGDEIPQKHVPLKSAFFQPAKLEEAGIEPIFRGFASQAAQALDPLIVDDVRNFLILSPGDQQGFDLAALNIQRGRDHRLPAYNDVRESFGLRRIEDFHDPIWRSGFGDKLAEAYYEMDDVDLWVGGLAEKPVGNALTGEMLQAILLEQFRRLRHGDRFWYEEQFYDEEIDELNRTTLADIIKRNTPIQKNEIQNNVFIASEIHDPVDVNATPGATNPTIRLAPASADPAEENRKNRIKESIHKGYLG